MNNCTDCSICDCIHSKVCYEFSYCNDCNNYLTEEQIRTNEINKFKDWFEENYYYDSYICSVVLNIINKYAKQKGEPQ